MQPRTVDATLHALADPTRRAVVGILRSGPQQPSHLADALSTSRPIMSRHLRVLRRAGLVIEALQQEDARTRVYELRAERLVELRGWLDEVTEFWASQLDAFKSQAEKRSRKGKR
jgi:DNA-binding transcriptional ArsR family regulator